MYLVIFVICISIVVHHLYSTNQEAKHAKDTQLQREAWLQKQQEMQKQGDEEFDIMWERLNKAKQERKEEKDNEI